MAWLLRQGEVLASLELAETLAERARQMAGRSPSCCALLVRDAPSPHSIGARDRIDVAYLDDALVVVAVTSLAPFRLGLPRRRSRHVLEAPTGAFERWNLRPGDRLEVKE